MFTDDAPIPPWDRADIMVKTERAPNGEWYAIDANNYDGAPDAGRAGAMGWGSTEQEAKDDLIEKLSG